ncbi:MAG: 3'-5' exonuclease [Paludibacteraceae bacterium]
MNSGLQKIMFIDIETVPQTGDFNELPEDMQHLWEEKFALLQRKTPEKYGVDLSAPEGYATGAGIYAEFGRIVCISVGFIFYKEEKMFFRTKSFADKNEYKLLSEFCELVNKFFTSGEHNFCGHNIKEFDIPYICRRILIHSLPLPKALQLNARKPWEVNLLDTLDFWKFGDYKNFASLKLLTAVFSIPTPKDDIDGSQVAGVFYKEDNLPRIAAYCQKDVLATAQVWLRMNGLESIAAENVQHV